MMKCLVMYHTVPYCIILVRDTDKKKRSRRPLAPIGHHEKRTPVKTIKTCPKTTFRLLLIYTTVVPTLHFHNDSSSTSTREVVAWGSNLTQNTHIVPQKPIPGTRHGQQASYLEVCPKKVILVSLLYEYLGFLAVQGENDRNEVLRPKRFAGHGTSRTLGRLFRCTVQKTETEKENSCLLLLLLLLIQISILLIPQQYRYRGIDDLRFSHSSQHSAT